MKVVFKQGSGDLFQTKSKIFLYKPQNRNTLSIQKKLLINLGNANTAEEGHFLIGSKTKSPIYCTGVILETEGNVWKIQKRQGIFS